MPGAASSAFSIGLAKLSPTMAIGCGLCASIAAQHLLGVEGLALKVITQPPASMRAHGGQQAGAVHQRRRGQDARAGARPWRCAAASSSSVSGTGPSRRAADAG